MNKIVSTKNTSAIFLAIVLVTGTITLFSPPFMKGVQAEPYFGMDNNYDKSYGKDNSYKFKDNMLIKKIKCNNINVNVNGLELNGLPSSLTSLFTGGEATNEGEYGASPYGSGYGQSGYDNNSFKSVCINNNNNTVIEVEEPPVNECAEDIEVCFEEFLASELFELLTEALESSAGLTVEINGEEVTLRSFEDICDALKGLTFEQLADAVFNIITEVAPQPIIIIGSELFNCIAEALDIPIPR